MNFKCRVRMILLLFLVIFFQACSDKSKEKKADRFDNGTIYISCDESFKPVIDAEIEVYQASYPDAHINVQYKPEADCLRDFGVDSIRMIIATRGFSEKESQFMIDSLKVGPVQATVAHDAIAVIIHPDAKDYFFTMDRI